jgi:hypothetical protein
VNIKNLQAEIYAIDQEALPFESGEGLTAVYKKLLNIIERLASKNDVLESENQTLRDEINRLKGEQGKPDINANKKKSKDISSEAERKLAAANANKGTENTSGDTGEVADEKKKRQRESKLSKIKIDREHVCPLDKNGLPDDLEFKGYEDVVVQNIIITTDNVKYRREIFYSPSQRKTYLGELPDEVRGHGEYGAGVRSLIPILKTEGNMSEKRILGFLRNFGLVVSATYLSRQWTKGYELFHQEKSDLYRNGIAVSAYAQIDDTSARVNGTNQYCQIVCSPLFTAYFTTENKDRLTVLDVLTDFTPRQYLYNQQAKELLDTFGLTDKARIAIEARLPSDTVLNESEFEAHLGSLSGLSARQKIYLTEATAIAYYQQQTEYPIIETLLCDNAPQFKRLTPHLGLCWIHDARHYKKLQPVAPSHRLALTVFQGRYWKYYAELLKFKIEPTRDKKELLETQFDQLFSTSTGYDDLDDRIAKTRANKAELLRVLDLPQLPLHNNDAELGARVQARVRDVSYQTRTDKGTKIKDTFMTINQTAKKLGVSFYAYVHDRVTGQFQLPSLADLILQKAQLLSA